LNEEKREGKERGKNALTPTPAPVLREEKEENSGRLVGLLLSHQR